MQCAPIHAPRALLRAPQHVPTCPVPSTPRLPLVLTVPRALCMCFTRALIPRMPCRDPSTVCVHVPASHGMFHCLAVVVHFAPCPSSSRRATMTPRLPVSVHVTPSCLSRPRLTCGPSMHRLASRPRLACVHVSPLGRQYWRVSSSQGARHSFRFDDGDLGVFQEMD